MPSSLLTFSLKRVFKNLEPRFGCSIQTNLSSVFLSRGFCLHRFVVAESVFGQKDCWYSGKETSH